MINFINKTVEILAHILYNKGQANRRRFACLYTIIEQEDKKHEFKRFRLQKGWYFAAGVLFGTAGIKALSSKDAKNLYTKATAAAVLRAKDCVLNVVSTFRRMHRISMQVHSRSMTSAQQQRMQLRLRVRTRQQRL